MNQDPFISELFKHFPHDPTSGQIELIYKIARFLAMHDNNSMFILRGYAGTGKTTFIKALVNSLPSVRLKSVLLAPTGRAAKVMSAYSKQSAFTIHKKIYRTKGDGISFSGGFTLQQNLHTNTLFIVDEASMIGEGNAETQSTPQSLLDDLYEYVYSGNNCRIIFIGDIAQLPPVGLSLSPALDPRYLKDHYFVNVFGHELKQVVRQAEDSGILQNATEIRECITNASNDLKLSRPYIDVVQVAGNELQDTLESAYSKQGNDNVMIICRSNKRATIYNQQIRSRILWREDEISTGDLLMVVKNNYAWLPENSKASFIANGDIIKVNRIRKIEELYGFRFATLEVELIDYPEEPEIEVKIFLDLLGSDQASLPYENIRTLFSSIEADHSDEPVKSKRIALVKKSPYYNALQVKFAYAVTCHKAQGGQWPCVFIEQGFAPNTQPVEEHRWLYTALTRASETAYLVNFPDSVFN